MSPLLMGFQPHRTHQPFFNSHWPRAPHLCKLPLALTPNNPPTGCSTPSSSGCPIPTIFFLLTTFPSPVDSSYRTHRNVLSQPLKGPIFTNFCTKAFYSPNRHSDSENISMPLFPMTTNSSLAEWIVLLCSTICQCTTTLPWARTPTQTMHRPSK